MGKHTLNKRQQLRIKKQQQQKRERAEIHANSAISGDEQIGLVIALYGKSIEIDDQQNKIHRCHLRQNLGEIAVGDEIIWQSEQNDTHVIVAVKPRRSALYRFNKFTGDKLVAANIDQMLIVIAPEPLRAMNVLDRYLMLAELQNIKPIIVFNKIDLCDQQRLHEIKDYLQDYHSLNYSIIYTSSKNNTGIDTLRNQLKNNTSIFVGISGVGKSSLINTLLPEPTLMIGELSEKSREGNHTTTIAKLYHLTENGKLIDCPGIRELAIGNITVTEVLKGFKELAEIATTCQFRDCSHHQEPGCALLKAAENGFINRKRLNSYWSIIEQLKA